MRGLTKTAKGARFRSAPSILWPTLSGIAVVGMALRSKDKDIDAVVRYLEITFKRLLHVARMLDVDLQAEVRKLHEERRNTRADA